MDRGDWKPNSCSQPLPPTNNFLIDMSSSTQTQFMAPCRQCVILRRVPYTMGGRGITSESKMEQTIALGDGADQYIIAY